jgi:hypothetical protein
LPSVGYAAITLPKNSVGSKQLKKGAVTGVKIKNGAVGANKVKDGSLLAGDFKAGQLPAGAKGDTGPAGPKGDTGAPGLPGGAVVARARSTGTLTPATATTFEQYPMTGNTWTQAADELNFALLKAEVTNNACDNNTIGLAGEAAFLRVKLDGAVVVDFLSATQSPTWTTVPIDLGPGTATPHTLTVEATHGCNASGSFTIDSVSIDVIGVR